mmetsp:Transcript_21658/g.69957  ORF Transcript_21658/g.69957 Transcript_21658/m.69957 type:complete len:111 (+) Transcript_21658:166-498(+)
MCVKCTVLAHIRIRTLDQFFMSSSERPRRPTRAREQRRTAPAEGIAGKSSDLKSAKAARYYDQTVRDAQVELIAAIYKAMVAKGEHQINAWRRAYYLMIRKKQEGVPEDT